MTTAIKHVEDVARELGFSPSSNFVCFENGVVGFSAGKPDEVELLAFRAIRAGYPLSRGLAKAAGFTAERISAIAAELQS